LVLPRGPGKHVVSPHGPHCWAPEGGRAALSTAHGVAEKLIEELEGDEEARRRLARLLVPAVYEDNVLRVAVLNAVSREVATRGDLAGLEARLEAHLSRLEARMERIESRIDTLIKWVIGLLASMWVSLVAALLASMLH